MADSPATPRKVRKQNFSASEISVLTEKVEENLSVLQSKLTNSVTNQRKNEIWKEIADAVNAVGAEKRTTAEVREKWKNLHSQAKKEFSGFKRETKKTGGGQAPKEPSAATAKIIDLMKETPSFTGLEGFESIAVAPVEASADELTRSNEDEPAAEGVDTKEVECCSVPDLSNKNLKEAKCSIKRKSRKVTQEQVLEEQYKALLLKRENLKLKKRKLELEVALLEQKVKKESQMEFTTINLSPIVTSRPLLLPH